MGKCISCRKEYDLTDLVQFETKILWHSGISTMRQVTLCRDCYRDPDTPMDSVTLECGEPEEYHPEKSSDKIFRLIGQGILCLAGLSAIYTSVIITILWLLGA